MLEREQQLTPLFDRSLFITDSDEAQRLLYEHYLLAASRKLLILERECFLSPKTLMQAVEVIGPDVEYTLMSPPSNRIELTLIGTEWQRGGVSSIWEKESQKLDPEDHEAKTTTRKQFDDFIQLSRHALCFEYCAPIEAESFCDSIDGIPQVPLSPSQTI